MSSRVACDIWLNKQDLPLTERLQVTDSTSEGTKLAKVMKQSSHFAVLRCFYCHKELPISSLAWRCDCGGILDVQGTSIFPKSQLGSRPNNFWRYRESLALTADMQNVSLGETMTPIQSIGLCGWRVKVKLEYVLPTGSYKDRGIAVCMTHLKALGAKVISEDSSGNAGASTAAYAAAAGIRAGIYVPDGTSPTKLGQIAVYGAELNKVAGTRSASAERAQDVLEGCRYIGHSWNPFFACGIKTIAHEIAEQTNWSPPDWIVTPLGGGSLVLGLIDGFEELLSAGYIQKSPRILAVQSEACAPIYRAWIRNSCDVEPITPQSTSAEGVALPSPARGSQVLESIRRNNGIVAAVNDEDLLSSWKNMAHLGYLIEPTSAVAVAGAWQARQRNQIGQGEEVLIVLTGNGLKTKSVLLENMINPKL